MSTLTGAERMQPPLATASGKSSLKVTAPNIYGAKRTTTYSVAIHDVQNTSSGGSTWRIDSIYP